MTCCVIALFLQTGGYGAGGSAAGMAPQPQFGSTLQVRR